MKKGSKMKVREEALFHLLVLFSLLPEFSFSLGSISREIRANRTPEGTGGGPKEARFFLFLVVPRARVTRFRASARLSVAERMETSRG